VAQWEYLMTRKVLSLITAAATLYVYLLSQLRSGDVLFSIASSGWAVNAGLVAISSYCVYTSFRDKFRANAEFIVCMALGLSLAVFGGAGIIYSGFDNYFSELIKPLDFLILLQAGIILGICSLSYEHAPIRLKLSLPSLSIIKTSLLEHLPSPNVAAKAAPARPSGARSA
jgi:hypothetical protein